MAARMLMIVLLVALVLSTAAADTPAAEPDFSVYGGQNTFDEIAPLFNIVAIQDGGRVKPLQTYATYKLLQFSGRKSLPSPTETMPPLPLWIGRRMFNPSDAPVMEPTEWLINCLLRPQFAKSFKVFRVENSDVVAALGLPTGKKRDRYSWNDLAPARDDLLLLARRAARMGADQPGEMGQLLRLASNFVEYSSLLEGLEFARARFDAPPGLVDRIEGEAPYTLSELLAAGPALVDGLERNAHDDQGRALMGLLRNLQDATQTSMELRLFPPRADEELYRNPDDLFRQALAGQALDSQTHHLLMAFERLAIQDEPAPETVRWIRDELLLDLKSRGDRFSRLSLEVTYNGLRLVRRSLVAFLVASLLIALSWLHPERLVFRNKTRQAAASRTASILLWLLTLTATLLLAGDITLRCLIRSRPPVTTLYETILFATFMAALSGLVLERLNRRGVGVSLAALIGVSGLLLANRYEMAEGGDTMPSMIAVLDTNFWLTLHVTTIAVGYAAMLLAGGLGHLYVIGRFIRLRRNDPDFYRDLARMTYGVLCFALLFTVAGTVLGGVWANESWGRFWGWDPKENGALMLVLWQLFILHARLGGYLRDFGTALAAVFGTCILMFSWFGTNLLGVGLHTYGFTSGAQQGLLIFYTVETVVLAIGVGLWTWDWTHRHAARMSTPRA